MPRLIIDNQEIEVSEGTKVIDAAERLGIMIPRFCFHPALGSVGACRVCAVMFLEGPVKGVEMSCMHNALDGMVISTTDPEAVEFRKYIIECLMLNHPLDCPVCDEGGHCLLQDQTVAGGHGIRRYPGKKRTYHDQDLGIFVQHEMNRCIHCFRCRRFYQEFAGYRDLGVMQIGDRMYFGRIEDGELENPFSGNLIDVCPTGVYTDKPARFKGRRWDFERSPSICLHCSLGCNTMGSGRYREIVRLEARVNESVNGHFICDRGRFGFDYTNLRDRPRQARIKETEVPLDQGILAAAQGLRKIAQEAGPDAVFCLGSSRSSLETQAALKYLCWSQGWPDPRFFSDAGTERKVVKAVQRLDRRLAVSMGEIEDADFLLVLGADPVNEAPMLALAMRQAHRKRAAIAVLDPRPVSLPFDFDHLTVPPGDLDLCLSVMVKEAANGSLSGKSDPMAQEYFHSLPDRYSSDLNIHADLNIQERLLHMGQLMKKSQRPVLICGTDIVSETTPELAADHMLFLKASGKNTGLFYILPGPNAFGAGLLSPSRPFPTIMESIEKGQPRAILLIETDPFSCLPDQERLIHAFERLELRVVLDYLPSQASEIAHIFLPVTTVFERKVSTFINQEGRAQLAYPVHLGGVPLPLVSKGGHPPRTFPRDVPGGEPGPASDTLLELAAAVSGKKDRISRNEIWPWLATENPVFEKFTEASMPTEGMRLLSKEWAGRDFSPLEKSFSKRQENLSDHLQILLVDQTFGTEELSGYSSIIRRAERPPYLYLHPQDAVRLGLEEGGKAVLSLTGGSLTLGVRVTEKMAPGVLIIPRHRQLAWQDIEGQQSWIHSSKVQGFPPQAGFKG